MMSGKFIRTVINLRLSQIFFQIFYKIFGRTWVPLKNIQHSKIHEFTHLTSTIKVYQENSFVFLNMEKVFHNSINWDYQDFGMLWCYNLNYFDFLNQPDLEKIEKLRLIREFIFSEKRVGLQPYPTSLRLNNWIKFISNYQIYDEDIIDHLQKDINRLLGTIEYQIGANHVLENSFALYFTAHLFPVNNKLVQKSIKLLTEQLNEQILNDGGHYERSFMYHQILLGRLLESISISQKNPYEWNIQFVDFLRVKAEKMMSWMLTISNNGNKFLRFNDSVELIAPTTSELSNLASALNINSNASVNLSDSGFRKLKIGDLFLIANVGSITPSYQPGHAHADTFSFILDYRNEPLIVDPGISTYENSQQRELERSTAYHNTVSINSLDNNEVWKSFRVGRRANVQLVRDESSHIIALHDGFKVLKSTHQREWIVEKNRIIVNDKIKGALNILSESYYHFHPSTTIDFLSQNSIIINNSIRLDFHDFDEIRFEKYQYCIGFNNRVEALKAIVSFKDTLKVIIGK